MGGDWPKEFRLHIGGYGGPSYSVDLQGDHLLYESIHGDCSSTRSREVRPAAEDWLFFWEELESLGVWDWQAEYVNAGVCDGTQWEVGIQYGEQRLHSSGDNSYPRPNSRPNRSPEPTQCFRGFCGAVSRLLGGLPFQ